MGESSERTELRNPGAELHHRVLVSEITRDRHRSEPVCLPGQGRLIDVNEHEGPVGAGKA
jgi:hypothetical protein